MLQNNINRSKKKIFLIVNTLLIIIIAKIILANIKTILRYNWCSDRSDRFRLNILIVRIKYIVKLKNIFVKQIFFIHL